MAERTDWIEFVPVYVDEGEPDDVTIELLAAASDDAASDDGGRILPRVLGWISILAGSIGVVLGVALVWVGLGVVDDAAASLDDGLTVADDTLAAILDTLDVVDRTVGTTADSLLEMQISLGSVGGSIRRVDGLLGETSDVVAGEIADSIDSLVGTLPGLIEVGDTLDLTLRSLSFLGIPYDPDRPIGDGFRDMEAALADVPGRLRLQGRLLDEMKLDLASTGVSLDRVRGDIGEIRSELEETSALLDRYRAAAADGTALVADIRDQVDDGAPVARIFLIVFGGFMVLYQVVPLWLGWRLTRGDRLMAG